MKVTKVESHNGEDLYDHDIPGLIYTASNIPGPGADVELFDCVFTAGCACVDGKCDGNSLCACVSTQGTNYSARRLLENKFAGPVLECGSACFCSVDVCENRAVQFGPLRGLKTFETLNGKGLGLTTTTAIAAGTFICEYAGEIVDAHEAGRRCLRDAVNYVLAVGEHCGGSGGVVKTYVDPNAIGNIGRYANHSCRPNAAMVPVRYDQPLPKLALFAKRSIRAGEEIAFDYADGGSCEFHGDYVRIECFCGEVNCRGFLPFDADLFEDLDDRTAT